MFESGGAKHLLLSVLLDTGATDTFFREFFRSFMRNRKKSSAQIMIADDTLLEATEEGVVPAFVLNTTTNPDVGLGTAMEMPGMIVPGMRQELISVTHYFEKLGFSIHLRPEGACGFYKMVNDGKVTIPIRWDAVEKGFFMDIVVSEDPTMQQLAAAVALDRMDLRSSARVAARDRAAVEISAVEETIKVMLAMVSSRNIGNLCTNDARVARHTDPLNCRLQLTGKNAGMSRDKAAKLFAHIGCEDKLCWVCRQVRGTAPYKPKIPADMRVRIDFPNFRLTIDFVQWSSRSQRGNNYSAVIFDPGSRMFYGVHTVFKDDIYGGVYDFITQMRKDRGMVRNSEERKCRTHSRIWSKKFE